MIDRCIDKEHRPVAQDSADEEARIEKPMTSKYINKIVTRPAI
jgi:hypothetical protein